MMTMTVRDLNKGEVVDKKLDEHLKAIKFELMMLTILLGVVVILLGGILGGILGAVSH